MTVYRAGCHALPPHLRDAAGVIIAAAVSAWHLRRRVAFAQLARAQPAQTAGYLWLVVLRHCTVREACIGAIRVLEA